MKKIPQLKILLLTTILLTLSFNNIDNANQATLNGITKTNFDTLENEKRFKKSLNLIEPKGIEL